MQDGFTLAFFHIFRIIAHPQVPKCDGSDNIKSLILNQLHRIASFELRFDIHCKIV